MSAVEGGVGAGPTVLGAAWRYRYVVLAVAVVAGVAAAGLSTLRPTVYLAETRLFLADPRSGGVFDTASRVEPERYVPQQAERVTSTPVLERLVEILGDDAPPVADLRDRIDAEGDISLDLITVIASAPTAEEAAALADAAAQAYRDVSRDVKLEAAQRAAAELEDAARTYDEQIAALQEDADPDDAAIAEQLDILVRERIDLTTRAQQLVVDARVFGSGVDLTELAEVPSTPTSPQPARDGILFGVLAAALAVALVYVRAGALRRVESRREPADILGIPLLGTIPAYEGKPRLTLQERSAIPPAIQDAYHLVLTSVLHELSPDGTGSFVVTSAAPGDGKTEVSLQLALVALAENRSVLLVDGDLRAARVSELTGLSRSEGVVDIGAYAEAEEALLALVRPVPVLDRMFELPVLPAGIESSTRSSVLRDVKWVRGMRQLESVSDLVVIDSAPILATADTTALAGQVDGMVLVVRHGVEVRVLERVAERLRFVGTRVLGYVYVGGDAGAPAGYGYGYGYGYGRTERPSSVGEVVLPSVTPGQKGARSDGSTT